MRRRARPTVSMADGIRGKTPSKLADINEFLREKRIAFVGVSRNAQDYTRAVMREFMRCGYEVLPVNPKAAEMDGRRCFAQVKDIVPVVIAALIFTPPELTEQAVRECAAAGVQRIWIRRGARDTAAAATFCRDRGLRVIAGECPLMFLPGTGFIHHFHGAVARLVGLYPR